jgi:hypothetical protein
MRWTWQQQLLALPQQEPIAQQPFEQKRTRLQVGPERLNSG